MVEKRKIESVVVYISCLLIMMFFIIPLGNSTHLTTEESSAQDDDQYTSQDSTVSSLDSDLLIINDKLSTIESSNAKLQEVVSQLSIKLDELNTKLSSNEESQSLQLEIENLKTLLNGIDQKISAVPKDNPKLSPSSTDWPLVLGSAFVFILIIALIIIKLRKKKKNVVPTLNHLEQYVKDSLNRGYSENQIRGMLYRSGHRPEEVNAAFSHSKKGGFEVNIS